MVNFSPVKQVTIKDRWYKVRPRGFGGGNQTVVVVNRGAPPNIDDIVFA